MTRALALLTVCSLFACTTVNSQDIKTAGMSAHMTVTADGSGSTQVSATLNVDTNSTDFVNLTASDKLTVTAGTQSSPMTASTLLGIVTYSASFQGEDAAGTLYTVDLNRPTDTSAPSSTCTLPNALAITVPTSSGSFSRTTSDISVTWSGSGTSDAMSFDLNGNCVGDLSNSISGDSGSLTIAKGTLQPLSTGGNCQVTLTLTRQRPGSLDKAYGYGGNIVGQQTRSVTFLSTP